jgi:hypothetical protein
MAITVIVAELPKPEIPSSGVTNPNTIKAKATQIAVKSMGNHSKIKQVKAVITTLRAKKIVMFDN